MKNIYILEYFDFSEEQLERLNKLGNVKFFDKAEQKDIDEAIKNADVIMLDWIDPTNIINKLKKGSFVNLPFTGYGWISTINEALNNGVIISNTPNYSTNAVAEHHLSLMLSAAKHVVSCNEGLKSGNVPETMNIEISNKTVGIIGFGHIGYRLFELLKGFNVEVLTATPNDVNVEGVKKVSLEELLTKSDFVCVTCKLNETTKNMIGKNQLNLLKPNAVLTATTNEVINLTDLNDALNQGKLFGVGLEEFMSLADVPMNLINNPKVVCTYHRAYNTKEAEINRLNLSIDNIEAYINGKPINQIKG